MNPQILLLFLLPLLLISIEIIPECVTAEPYSSCSNLFSCGSIKDVGYPFWGGTTRGSLCGYPELELTCEGNSVANIEISNVQYNVLQYYPTTKILKISRKDYSTGSLCSPNFVNTTLDPNRFDLVTGYTNFTFLYGCPSLSSIFPGQFSCRIDGVPYSTGYIEVGSVGGCFNSVVVPLSQTLVTQITSNSSDSFVQSLGDGFEVRVKADDAACNECTQSGGVCGYDSSQNRTTCYCKGQSLGSTTCSSSSSNGSTAAGIIYKLIYLLNSLDIYVVSYCQASSWL